MLCEADWGKVDCLGGGDRFQERDKGVPTCVLIARLRGIERLSALKDVLKGTF